MLNVARYYARRLSEKAQAFAWAHLPVIVFLPLILLGAGLQKVGMWRSGQFVLDCTRAVVIGMARAVDRML